MTKNRLAEETSPYLLQHKDNPVHWQRWDEAALTRARDEDKPILLSIGYSACHWCHVMAHESFENDDIAAIMNERFINVKVDREERPDLDAVYQAALSMLGEQGGWPLTMFLTADGTPFWGGTYFPPTSRYGRPGFSSILSQIAEVHHNERAKVEQNAGALGAALREFGKASTDGALNPDMLQQAAASALQIIDFQKGGTSGAPKFPQPTLFRFLWQAALDGGPDQLRTAVTLTLGQICQGGIYDHLGGGIARYSVDANWLVPHFEKMLYDNAQFVELMSDVWMETKAPLYRTRVHETIDWMLRDLRAEHADEFALASAYDADSEGVEGKYYVWSMAEITETLGDDAALFAEAYDITEHGNWEGANILNRHLNDVDGTADSEGRAQILADCRNKLLGIRGKRVPPMRDDKVLADWNGLAVAALVRAATVFDEPSWIEAAKSIFAFVKDNMGIGERLYHTWCAGQASHGAVIDDYANMSRAALLLYQATGNDGYLESARTWTTQADHHYWDGENGGYFLAADDTPGLIVRTKPIFDNATPSGNGTMLEVLARLYLITGDAAYRERADDLVRALAPSDPRGLMNQPSLAIGFGILQSGQQIVIVLPEGSEIATDALYRAAIRHASSDAVVYPVSDAQVLPAEHPANGKTTIDGHATAYICRGSVCGLPITETDALIANLTTSV